MTVELKVFGSNNEPQKSALKQEPELKNQVEFFHAKNKSEAAKIGRTNFVKRFPELADCYFKPKVWEDRPGLPRTPVDSGFYDDFFDTLAVWNSEAGEPEAMPIEPAAYEEKTGGVPEEMMHKIKPSDRQTRAAVLTLFGPVEEITEQQYGLVLDLLNDDGRSFEKELAEAIMREPRVLALTPERQIELMACVRETVKETAQWTDIAKAMTKWLDTPPGDRQPKSPHPGANDDNRTDSGATLGGKNCTDRSPDMVHNLSTLRLETALGVLATAMDFDIYSIPSEIMRRAKAIEEMGNDPRFSAWWTKLRSTPGILDYSRAAIIALIKTAPEDLYRKPIDLREYICRELVETDHAHPSQALIDIACGTVRYSTEKSTNDEAKPPVSGEAIPPANDQPKIENLGAGKFSIERLMDEPAPNEQAPDNESKPELNEREIEIAHALNDLISGCTGIMGKEEAEGVIACTGYLIPDIFPLLIADIVTTEFCLSPDFSNEEIQDVATTIIEIWSDDINIRQKIALDAIVEYRKPAPPKQPSQPELATTSTKQEPTAASADLTWRQQLIIAAVQGMCANPAYSGIQDDIPGMAIDIASGVIRIEEATQ